MSKYDIEIVGDTLNVGFGDEPASSDELVKIVRRKIRSMVNDGELTGGKLLRINGKQSVPITAVITSELKNLYSAIAYYVPSEQRYVVAVTISGQYQLGDLLE